MPKDLELRKELIQHAHNPTYSGHTGRARTLEHLKRDFHWTGMSRDVELFVRTCDKCQRNKSGTQKPGGPLQPTETPNKFWECVTMDLITQLPPTATGYDAIAVFVDKLSKMTHIRPCKTNIDAPEFADLMLDAVFKHHGLPRSIISDRDARFTGKFLTTLADRLEFRQRLSTAFHPQTDGQTERMNRVVEDMVRHYVGPYHDDWDTKLGLVEFAINNAWQASIGDTPFHAIYGEHPFTPLSLQVRTEARSRSPAEQKWFASYAERAARAKASIAAAQDRQKAYADTSRRAVKYSRDQYVWLSAKHVHFKAGGPVKFLPKIHWTNCGGNRAKGSDHRTSTNGHSVPLATTRQLQIAPSVPRLTPQALSVRWRTHPRTGRTRVGHGRNTNLSSRSTSCGARGPHSRKRFLVRWLGYSPAHDTWERESDILDPELVQPPQTHSKHEQAQKESPHCGLGRPQRGLVTLT